EPRGLERSLGRRLRKSVMEPAMPIGWHPARLDCAVVDHPAAGAVLVLIIAVAEGVSADGRAVQPGMQPGPQSLRFPPRKEHAGRTQGFACDYRTRGAVPPSNPMLQCGRGGSDSLIHISSKANATAA